jgi:hypothetical protein
MSPNKGPPGLDRPAWHGIGLNDRDCLPRTGPAKAATPRGLHGDRRPQEAEPPPAPQAPPSPWGPSAVVLAAARPAECQGHLAVPAGPGRHATPAKRHGTVAAASSAGAARSHFPEQSESQEPPLIRSQARSHPIQPTLPSLTSSCLTSESH